MDLEPSRPIAQVFLHPSGLHRRRIEQVLQVADHARRQALATMQWLDRELASRQHIADDAYSMAGIVAQCAFVLGKAVGLRIPPEMTHLSRWFAAVSGRPTARA